MGWKPKEIWLEEACARIYQKHNSPQNPDEMMKIKYRLSRILLCEILHVKGFEHLERFQRLWK